MPTITSTIDITATGHTDGSIYCSAGVTDGHASFRSKMWFIGGDATASVVVPKTIPTNFTGYTHFNQGQKNLSITDTFGVGKYYVYIEHKILDMETSIILGTKVDHHTFVVVVPESSTAVLFGAGILIFWGRYRKQNMGS